MKREVLESNQIRWWIWSLLLALAISASQNAMLVICLILIVFAAMKTSAQVQRYSLSTLMRLLAALLILRITFQMFFGVPVGNNVIFKLPEINLFSGGLRVGGIFTLESLQTATNEAIVLGGIILALIASSMMIPVSSLLRRLPSGFSNIALVLSIALSFLPQLVNDVKRNVRANRWRGQSTPKISILALNFMNVIENALEKSIQVSASMWRRGLGSDTQTSTSSAVRLVGSIIFFCALLVTLIASSHTSLTLLMLLGASLVIYSYRPLSIHSNFRGIISSPSNLLMCAIGCLVAGIWLFNDATIEFTFICLIALLSGLMHRVREVRENHAAYSGT